MLEDGWGTISHVTCPSSSLPLPFNCLFFVRGRGDRVAPVGTSFTRMSGAGGAGPGAGWVDGWEECRRLRPVGCQARQERNR